MTTPLESAREIRLRIADGDPPDGWPVVTEEGAAVTDVEVGRPVPKCSLFECPEPGVYKVGVWSLLEVSGWTSYSCLGHLDHFARAAAEWVRP